MELNCCDNRNAQVPLQIPQPLRSHVVSFRGIRLIEYHLDRLEGGLPGSAMRRSRFSVVPTSVCCRSWS